MRTLDKIEYLRLCISNRAGITKKSWYVKALGIPTLKTEDISGMSDYDLVTRPDGLYFIEHDVEDSLVKITDWVKGEPLFKLQDMIPVDRRWLLSIENEIETKVGILIINAIMFTHELQQRIPFLNLINANGKKWENEIIKRCRSSHEEFQSDSVTVEEKNDILDRLTFFESMGTIINTAATMKSITKAPGIDEFREKLFEKYKDRMNDPVALVELENELRAYDDAYLADDPVARNVMVKKSKVGRFSMTGMIGNTLNLDKDTRYGILIKRSIGDGLDADPVEFSKAVNDIRGGSVARGDKTALGGDFYKKIQRSLPTIRITDVPCNTTKGLVKTLDKHFAEYMMGRSYKVGGEWKVVATPEEAKSLAGQTIEHRSPMYCTEKGQQTCYACMSTRYLEIPSGVSNLTSDISYAVLNMFMKLMHGVTTTIVKIDRKDLFS